MTNGHYPAQGCALQYFPKKTKAVYTAAYLADCRQKINTRPRKCLGFASPASRFFYELRGLHFKVESATKLARCRIVIEHTFAHLKKWRILADRYRGYLDHYAQIFQTVAGIYNLSFVG